jgi:hypothetical protein
MFEKLFSSGLLIQPFDYHLDKQSETINNGNNLTIIEKVDNLIYIKNEVVLS